MKSHDYISISSDWGACAYGVAVGRVAEIPGAAMKTAALIILVAFCILVFAGVL